jgi:plastocyanin
MKYPVKPAHWVALTATLFFILIIAGCTSYGQSGALPTTTPIINPGESTIMIQNFAFSPASITVAKGTTVTWVNEDSVNHQVVSDSGAVFTSTSLPKGGSYSFNFNNPGTYPYHCSIHPSMKGAVIVT